MDETSETRTVTVIGAGTIGLGWVALFLGAGLRVRVVSRRGDVGDQVAEALAMFAPHLPGGAQDPAELATRLEIEPDLAAAVRGAHVVQENTEEDLEAKRELFVKLETVAEPDALLLSSTSTLPPDELGASMREPGRVVVGHPFNPPHVVPLVEVVAGSRTPAETVDAVVAFYRSVGKAPVVLRKPIARFVANRLQSALLQESIHLVREGVVTVAELDEVVTRSIGLRWATVGPFLAFHLGGGQGGLRHWLTTLGRGLEASWRDLGTPELDAETVELVLSQAETAVAGRTYAELVAERDAKQTAILAVLEDSKAQ
ncbi:3-hydroxyacyl-CoA dehydrogenase NAD-binding domain-containing protein [Saccharopolyspora sp. NPDC002686]|uniref:3-hydroxyacyl-CoA dehydrogenase NAD-binding domain-containing protein n=1 Tax=Saccharopolyspora sp. NPDC002686 TaxID=3154541 RepID=UPI003326F8D6